MASSRETRPISDSNEKRRMKVFHTPLSKLHNPPYEILSGSLQPYFESPSRYTLILSSLLSHPDSFEEVEYEWEVEQVETIQGLKEAVENVHRVGYLSYLKDVYTQWCNEGGDKAAVLPETFLRSDFLLQDDLGEKEGGEGSIARADTYICALASCALTLKSLDYILSPSSSSLSTNSHSALTTRNRTAFALCRPPGHHSTCSLAGGYCYLNNVAIVVKELKAREHRDGVKIVVLDIDYHHGNGTSKIFYEDPDVLYVSLHGSPDYPYFTGSIEEKGAGLGLGTNLNFPLPLGTDNVGYMKTLKEAIVEIENWKPDYLFVSLGVDTYIDDPLTNFELTLEVFPEIGNEISKIGNKVKGSLFVMEGGYCLDKIGDCVRGVLEGFLNGLE